MSSTGMPNFPSPPADSQDITRRLKLPNRTFCN